MSTKGYIINLSLAGTVAALSCLMFPKNQDPVPQSVAPSVKTAQKKVVRRTAPQTADIAAKQKKPDARTPAAASRPKPAIVSRPLSTEELTARAARVEQEANHELRRLVTLLNLDDVQQERVFQTLAEHSSSWVPGMQVASPAGDATTAGKRSEFAASQPSPDPVPVEESTGAKTPAAIVIPVADEPTAGDDPTDEIMALLDPDQQNTLIEAELDRAAWWAEILDQITPPDEVPSLTPSVPSTGAGDTQIYEGSDVLE